MSSTKRNYGDNPEKIEWVDELPAPSTPSLGSAPRYLSFAEKLKEQPGTWAIWKDVEPRTGIDTKAINEGKVASFRPAGAYEATTRTVDDADMGKIRRVFVRYIGNQNVV